MVKDLVCPQCRGELEASPHHLVCQKCNITYPIKGKIFVMWHSGLEKDSNKQKQMEKDLDFTKKYVAALIDENNKRLLEENLMSIDGGQEFYERDSAKSIAAKFVDKKALETIKKISGENLDGFRILNIGSGGGKEAMWMFEQGVKEVTCLDISEDLLLLSQERLKGKPVSYVVGNAEALPFKDKSFDMIVFHGTLHHVKNYDLAISEACRVALRVAFAGEPTTMGPFINIIKLVGWSTEYGGLETNRFNPQEIRVKLEKNGFEARVKTNFVWFPFLFFGSLRNNIFFIRAYFSFLSVLDKMVPFGHNLTIFAKER